MKELEIDLQNREVNKVMIYYGLIYFKRPELMDEQIENNYEAQASSDNYLQLLDIERFLREEMVISGIKNLKKVYKFQDSDCIYRKSKFGDILDKKCSDGYTYVEPILLADGTNLKAVLQHPDVDTVRTSTNDVQEIYRVLGIEAARLAMFQEIQNCFNKYSIYINYRHICMLIDWMCNQGKIIPINRNGINRIPNSSALKRSSFEETCEMLFQAAVYSQYDNVSTPTPPAPHTPFFVLRELRAPHGRLQILKKNKKTHQFSHE